MNAEPDNLPYPVVVPDRMPPVGGMGGIIHSWVRASDPWHASAFPPELAWAAPGQSTSVAQGWAALDAFGNEIAFVADGTLWSPTVAVQD